MTVTIRPAAARDRTRLIDLYQALNRHEDGAYRRRGIAAALIREAEGIAVARGHSRLTISVMAGNREAEEAYARQGFRPLAHDLQKRIGER